MKKEALPPVAAFLRSTPMRLVLAVEVLVLIWFVWQAATPPAPLHWAAGELDSMSSEPLQTDADGYVGAETEQPAVAEGYSGLLATPVMELESGHYLVTVDYKASYHSTDLSTVPYLSFYSETPGTLQTYDGLIDPDATSQQFLVEVQHSCPDAQIIFTSRGCRFMVGSVTIRYDTAHAWVCVAAAAVGALLVNALLLRLLPGSPLAVSAGGRAAFAALAAGVLLSSLLLLQNGQVQGHDWFFHLSRIEFTAEALRSGQFPVRIYTTAKNGFGYGTPLFYGQLFLYFPALLRLLGFTVQQSIYAYIWAVNAATVGISYLCFYKIFRRRSLAVTGALLYGLAWYRLYCLYERAAVGEYTAMVFLPVLVYGLWKLYGPRDADRSTAWVPLMLAFSGFLQTHMLSLLMAALVALGIGLVFWRRTFRPAGLLTWGKAAGSCVLLNLWFFFPFLTASHGSLPGGGVDLAGDALSVAQLLTNDSEQTLGAGLWPGAVLFAALCLLRRRPSPLRGLGFTALGVAAVSCWLATDLCPWAWLQRSPIGPVVQTLQFPWRWLGVASLALTVVTLCGLAELLEDRGLPAALSAALLPVGLTLVTVVAFYQPLTPIDTELQPMIDGSQTKYWTDDLYLPEGAEPEMRWFVHDDPSGLTVRSLARADGVVTIDCAADGQDGSLELPLLYYPGYRVLDGSGALSQSGHGLVLLTVPEGWDGVITVGFREPKRWLLADLLSLLTAAGLGCLAVRRRRSDSN